MRWKSNLKTPPYIDTIEGLKLKTKYISLKKTLQLVENINLFHKAEDDIRINLF